MKYKYINIFILTIVVLLTSCHKRIELESWLTGDYDRKVGPEGKELVFLRNYSDDTILDDTLLKMNFIENTLDTVLIFNFYSLQKDELDVDLYAKFNLGCSSDFFYLLPSYEYINNDDSTNSYRMATHLSIDYNYPVATTYFIDTAKYLFLEETDKLYRITIPRDNEWDTDNIWLEFTDQGYPKGYQELDLQLIITGKWSDQIEYGYGDYSMINWEEVPFYTIDTENHSVTFEMQNTDYMYVLVYDTNKKKNKPN